MVQILRRAALLGVCAVLVIGAGLPALSQYVPRVGHTSQGRDGIVTVNGRVAIRFESPNAGRSPAGRAVIAARRLKPLAEGGWRSLGVKRVGRRRAQVVAGDRLICIVSAADAKKNHTTSRSLAGMWVHRLRALFSMPGLTVVPAQIIVPENETRSADIGGAAIGPLAAKDSNPSVATSEPHPTKREIVVRGKSVGRSVVNVTCQGCRTELVVNVKRYAGKLVKPEAVEVTGNPIAPSWIIEDAAAENASRSVVLEPGATCEYGRPRVMVDSIRRGELARVFVPAKVRGEGLIPTELLAPVDVVNRPVGYKTTNYLFYSNDPERIGRYGTLFTGKLALDERQRLLYHHQNVMGKRARFLIELINSGTLPASVQTVGGIAPPLSDTVVVGYFAGLRFLRSYLGDVGRVYRIPPKSKLVVYSEILGHMRTASGIIDIRQLSGEDVYLRIAAEPPGPGQLSDGGLASTGAGDVPANLSNQVFPVPAKQLSAKYIVGGPWAFIRIGKYAIPDQTTSLRLDGNYGVVYNIKIRVENPAGEAHLARVLFEPTAGPASGLFVLDGKIIGVKIINPPNEFEITDVRIAPGESKEISIVTIPLSGSAYPATIVVRP